MYGNTGQDTRRLLQLAFNRPNSHPAVLVAQSVVGREGLNLHKACKTVILLHPEWNPGVVEQQVGRVDRVGSLWEKTLAAIPDAEDITLELPRIAVRPVIFKGTYDEKTKTLTSLADEIDPQTKEKVQSKYVTVYKDDDSRVFSVSMKPKGASDFQPFMEIRYKRRAK